MQKKVSHMQLGKNGITENFLSTLKSHFDRHKTVRISVLRSACRDRDELKKISQKILEKLGENFSARIIGFVVIIRKQKFLEKFK
ncbi:MAG: YhbY family RNA-binding protein [archaeon]